MLGKQPDLGDKSGLIAYARGVEFGGNGASAFIRYCYRALFAG
jgi:hypothetical protein